MEQGTFHYVQRYIGDNSQTKEEIWSDVPFVKDGNVEGLRWRARRFVTAANYIDSLRKQEIESSVELERYRVVKRTFQEEVIVPRWRYIELLTGVGADGVAIWERIAFGDEGAVWRCRSFSVAKDEIKTRLEPMSADAKFRIVNTDGEVQAEFDRSDFNYDDLDEDIADLDEDLNEDEVDEDEEEDAEYDGSDDSVTPIKDIVTETWGPGDSPAN